jgi:hypothetical protein
VKKRSLIVSCNPDESCIFAEIDIAKTISESESVTAVNLNRAFNHIHPEAKGLDYVYEYIDRKFERLILPKLSEEPIKLETTKKSASSIPPIPPTIDGVRAYKIENVSIGLAALSTAASFSRSNSNYSNEYGKFLPEAWKIAHLSYLAGKEICNLNFDYIYIFNGRHAISRPLIEVVSKNPRTQVRYYEFDYTRERYIVNETGFHNTDAIAAEINDTTADQEKAEAYFAKLSNGEINSEFRKIHSTFDKDRSVSSGTSKRKIVFFTSSPDEFFAINDNTCIDEDFKNQFEIASFLCKSAPQLKAQIIIRLHPYLKNKHTSWKLEWSFDELYAQGATIIQPWDSLSSYKLIDVADCCVTVGSTIGIESVFRGVPCIDIGKTIANTAGITASCKNIDDLISFLNAPYIRTDGREKCLKYGTYSVAPHYTQIKDDCGLNMTSHQMIKKASPSKYFLQTIKRRIKSNGFINKMYTAAYYFYTRKICEKIIHRIDSKMPLKGDLRECGYIFHAPESVGIDTSHLNSLEANKSLVLDGKFAETLNQVFAKCISSIYDYLGSSIIIDSLYITHIDAALATSVSANWHTDNVGHNIKIYLCIHGDGTIETCYIPGTHIKPYKRNSIEDLRMIGLRNRRNKSNQIGLKHLTGSLALFDTNGMHRGAYDNLTSTRRVLEIEIADVEKCHKLHGLAPIGIRSGPGTFYVTEEFLKRFRFLKLFDEKRMRQYSGNLFIYGENPTHYVV